MNALTNPSRSIFDVVREEIRKALAQLHTGLPAEVAKVNTREDGAVESVDVQALIEVGVLEVDREAGGFRRVTEKIPPLTRVPYLSPVFGGWILHAAPKPGDRVYLVFAERSLDKWMSGDGRSVDPGAGHMHGLSDPLIVARLDPWSQRAAGPEVLHPDDLYLGREDGSTFVRITPAGEVTVEGTAVKLGAGASRGVARADDTITIDATTDPALFTWLTAVHPNWAPYTGASVTGKISSSSSKVEAE